MREELIRNRFVIPNKTKNSRSEWRLQPIRKWCLKFPDTVSKLDTEARKLGYANVFESINSFSETLYVVFYNVTQHPVCKYCEQVKTTFAGFTAGYGDHCSNYCQAMATRPRAIAKTLASNHKEKVRIGIANRPKGWQDQANIRRRQTNLQRYGVENVRQHEPSLRKAQATTLVKHGYRTAFENKSIQQKAQHNLMTQTGKKDDITGLRYDSSDELDFIRKCNADPFITCISRGPHIPYIWEGKKHTYWIDFEITFDTGKHQLVEIKGSHHFYRSDLESGLLKTKQKAAHDYSIANGFLPFLFILDGAEVSLEEVGDHLSLS